MKSTNLPILPTQKSLDGNCNSENLAFKEPSCKGLALQNPYKTEIIEPEPGTFKPRREHRLAENPCQRGIRDYSGYFKNVTLVHSHDNPVSQALLLHFTGQETKTEAESLLLKSLENLS